MVYEKKVISLTDKGSKYPRHVMVIAGVDQMNSGCGIRIYGKPFPDDAVCFVITVHIPSFDIPHGNPDTSVTKSLFGKKAPQFLRISFIHVRNDEFYDSTSTFFSESTKEVSTGSAAIKG